MDPICTIDASMVVERLLEKDVLFFMMVFGMIICVTALRTVAGTIKSVARERTRREIAAYIAEGSMTPEQGERLLKAEDRHA